MFSKPFIDELVKDIARAVVTLLPEPRVAQRYFTIKQAGEYMGVTTAAVRSYIRQGLIPVCAKGGKLRWVDREDIDAFMRKIKR